MLEPFDTVFEVFSFDSLEELNLERCLDLNKKIDYILSLQPFSSRKVFILSSILLPKPRDSAVFDRTTAGNLAESPIRISLLEQYEMGRRTSTSLQYDA